jgi:hypothetical protein
MSRSAFLDSNTFFLCIENPRLKTVIDHAVNVGILIQTSITVVGEMITQIRDRSDVMGEFSEFNRLLDEWNTIVLFPNDIVRLLCFIMGDEETDTRILREITDRTHLAYAMAYHSDYFLTTDKNLQRYRIPTKIERETMSRKPDTMTIEEFKKRI